PTTIGSAARWVVGGGPSMRMRSLFSRTARAVLVYVIALLIAVAFPGVLSRVKTYLVDRPGLSALGGLAIIFGFVPLCVLLAVTIVGIPLIPVAVLLLLALLFFGFTVSAGWLGDRVPTLLDHRPAETVALGGRAVAAAGVGPAGRTRGDVHFRPIPQGHALRCHIR